MSVEKNIFPLRSGANRLRRIGKTLLWAGGFCSVFYVLFGYPVGGHRLCLTKGTIMTEADRLQQLKGYVLHWAGYYRATYSDFTLDDAFVAEAMDLYSACVLKNGYEKCYRVGEVRQTDVTFSVRGTDVNFYYEDDMGGGAEGAAFGMTGSGKNPFKTWGPSNFTPLGCGFIGAADGHISYGKRK